MKKYIAYILILLSTLIPSFIFAQSAVPIISTISSAMTLTCDTVTINGTNFSQNSSIILNGNIIINPTSWTSTSLVFKVPGTLAGGAYGVHDLFVRNSSSVESNHTSITTYPEPQSGVGGFGGYNTAILRDVCVTFQEFDNVVASKMKEIKVNWNTVSPTALTNFSKLTRNVNGAMTDQVDALKQKLFFGTSPLSNDEKAYLRLTVGGGGQYAGVYNTSDSSYAYSWRANGYPPLGDPSNDETTWNVNIITAPSAPTLSVVVVNCGSGFHVTWTKQNGATKYNLWRTVGAEASKFYSDLYTGMTTENNMTGGETYKYKVQAENSFGKSPFSKEVTYVFPVECAKAETPAISAKFKIGDTLKTTSNINVRATANGNILGQKVVNSYGTIVEGSVASSGYTWWKVDFQNGVDGWAVEDYLIKATLPDITVPESSTVPVNDQIVSGLGFNIGDTIVVKDGVSLNVRASASTASTSLGKQNGGSIGELVEGPKKVNGYIWWKINYHTGADGWSVENYFTKASSDTVASTATTNSSAIVSNSSLSQMSASSVVGVLKTVDQSSARSKGCYKYPDGSVIAQNMTDGESNYCVYLAKTTTDQQAANFTRMSGILAQYPKWNECAANTAELKVVNSKLGYFGDLTWQAPTEGEASYDLYLKCKDAISVLQYINQNRFEIHPAVWLYEKGFWIGRSTNGVPAWPPVKCDSCLSTSRAFSASAVISAPVATSNSSTPSSFISAPLARSANTSGTYIGATPVEAHPALDAAAIARAQNSTDPYDGLKYKETSSQALSSNEKTATYAYIDDSSDFSTNPLQYFSPCGSLLTQYARTGSVTLGRGPVYRSALATCSAINSTYVPEDSSVRTYACENFLYKSRVVGRATFAFTCKAAGTP